MSQKIHKNKNEFFASCPQGLEGLLAQEIEKLNVANHRVTSNGVHFSGYSEKVIELILTSAIASRVFKKLFSFTINSQQDFYDKMNKIKWKSIFEVGQSFKINTSFGGKAERGPHQFDNSLFVSQRGKDAICDHFMDKLGNRPNVDLKHPHIIVNCHIEPTDSKDKTDMVQISLDLTNSPISHRGYRQAKQLAPLRENLAAGMLRLCHWNPSDESFTDLTCGSGTMVFEALLMALNIPTSFIKMNLYQKNPQKPWAFLKHLWFTKDQYQKEHLDRLIKKYSVDFETLKLKSRIIVQDIDLKMLEQTKLLIEKYFGSQILSQIEFKNVSFSEFTPELNPGFIFANPPYGKRIELDEKTVHGLKNIIQQLEEGPSQQLFGFILPRKLLAQKIIDSKPNKNFNLYNGSIPIQLKTYPHPHR